LRAFQLEQEIFPISAHVLLDRSNNGQNKIVTGPGISLELKFNPLSNHRDQIFGFIFTSASLRKDALLGLIQEFNRNNPRQVWQENLLHSLIFVLVGLESVAASAGH
jgi:hypothetical protein